MKYFVAFLVFFFLAILTVSALPYTKVLGVSPDVVLVLVACWAMVRNREEALPVILMAGYLRDLSTSDPLGVSALALLPIVLLTVLREVRIVQSDFLPVLFVVASGTMFYFVISSGVLAITGEEVPWLDALGRRLAPALLLNMLITPIFYLPLRWLTSEISSPGPRARSALGTR